MAAFHRLTIDPAAHSTATIRCYSEGFKPVGVHADPSAAPTARGTTGC